MVSVFYLVIMMLWFIGGEVWIFTAARRDDPRLLLVALAYFVVAGIYGFASVALR